jgi:hypothetical protein
MEPVDEKEIERIFKRMGEPSWWILSNLEPWHGLPAIEIIRRVESDLREAAAPNAKLEPATTHYALDRMESDGVVRCLGEREVDVPVGHGVSRRLKRPVWVITGKGATVLERRRQVANVFAQRRLRLAGP